MIQVNCPGCGREGEFPDILRGLTAVCKNCGHRIPVAASGQQVAAAGDAITSAPLPTLPQASVAIPAHPAVGEAIQPSASPAPSQVPISPLQYPEVRPIEYGPFESPELPEWAIEYAKASLRVGLTVSDIEQRLVARGLPSAVAAAVVTTILEQSVQAPAEPVISEEGREWLHRILSAVVGCAYLLLSYWSGVRPSEGVTFYLPVGQTFLMILLPLSCIWIPAVIGWSDDPFRVTAVRWGGWLLLLLKGGYLGVMFMTISS